MQGQGSMALAGLAVVSAGNHFWIKQAGISRMIGAGKKTSSVGGKIATNRKRSPDWSSGLKQLYDQVVDEPLPDSFKELISRLDDDKR